MIAVVMAGGRAARFRGGVEKALLSVGKLTLLERSLEALSVSGVSKILVATSQHTPITAVVAAERGAEVVKTAGAGYHEDVIGLLDTHNPFLTLNVDVPFVRKAHVGVLLKAFEGSSLAGVLPISLVGSTVRQDSLVQCDGEAQYLWVGLNIVTPNPDTKIIELDDPLLAININNEEDLAHANAIADEGGL